MVLIKILQGVLYATSAGVHLGGVFVQSMIADRGYLRYHWLENGGAGVRYKQSRTNDLTELVVGFMTEVVAALIWEHNKFLICQRPAHKARGLLWEFVGGKVEPGETKEQALIRECQEELAVTLEVGEVFMDVTHAYPDLTVHLTLFHAVIREGVPQKLEHHDLRWITAKEIDAYAFCPADEEILNKLKNAY